MSTYYNEPEEKIKQFEAMTGVASSKLPHESTMPDWEYLLKYTKKVQY